MWGRIALLLVTMAVLSGCGERNVASDIDQSEANKIVAELGKAGIEANAKTETGGRGKFVVAVSDQSYQRAVTILTEKGLPNREDSQLKAMMNTSGFLPASRQLEALRFDYALSRQIVASLRKNPVVKDADVVVRQHSLSDGEKASVAVSLVIGANEAGPTRSEVTELLLKSMPGLTSDAIAISQHTQAVSSAEQPSFVRTWFGVRVFEEEYPRFLSISLSVLGIFGFIGAGFGYFYGLRKSRREDTISELPVLWQPEKGVSRSRE